MLGLDMLGAKSTPSSEPHSTGASWYSENKVAIWIAGLLAAGITGFLIYDHFATGYRFGYAPGAHPRGWKTGVGWKSEAHRIAADQEYDRWRAQRQAALDKELAPYRAAAALRQARFEKQTAGHRARLTASQKGRKRTTRKR
jgi:hypothetical protein